MKRMYDNTSNDGQMSTGQMATKDMVYMNTNMVNIQREDHSSDHGIVTQFNQTRVLPIIGKTSKAEIALKTVDIQTKSLPIFQPQVLIKSDLATSDINRLIYEVGLSATWKNSMLQTPPDGVLLDSLYQVGKNNIIPYPGGTVTVYPNMEGVYWAESTFTNNSGYLNIIDAFNQVYTFYFAPIAATDITLNTLFQIWTGTISIPPNPLPPIRRTCLTPVVVPSVASKIIQASIGLSGSVTFNLIIAPESTDGFSIGDSLQFFGARDTSFPAQPSQYTNFFTVRQKIKYQYDSQSDFIPSLVLDYSGLGSDTGLFQLSTNYSFAPGSMIQFTVADSSQFQQFDTISVTGNSIPAVNGNYIVATILSPTLISCPYNYATPSLPPGIPYSQIVNLSSLLNSYVIDLNVKNGGHIEFLTDIQEFAPIALQGLPTPQPSNGQLNLQLAVLPAGVPLPAFNYGFLRNYNGVNASTQCITAPVELKIDCFYNSISPQDAITLSEAYNGYYTISLLYQSPGVQVITLTPINKVLPSGGYSLAGRQFIMKLAPNFYTFDTRVDDVISGDNTSHLRFMRAIGLTPSTSLTQQKSTYPPTATIPSKTWERAYQVEWDFSAYRNLKWVTQDQTATLPNKPITFQDFGIDNGSSSYYNVYELNKFLNDTVNPSIERILDDNGYEFLNYEAFSLDDQLAMNYNAYKQLFQLPASSFLWSSSISYTIGTLAVSGADFPAFAFLAAKTGTFAQLGPLPTSGVSNRSWIYLGHVPVQANNLTLPFSLNLQSSQPQIGGQQMIASVQNSLGNTVGDPICIYFSYINNGVGTVTSIIPLPTFKTQTPSFHYNVLTLLSSIEYDGYGFATTTVPITGLTQQTVSLYDYARRSWGNTGTNLADEWFTFESNTSFKFLMDNFPSYCLPYEDTFAELRTGSSFPFINYWIWDSTDSLTDPRFDSQFYRISQTSESLSSCMSPVESIVVVSENIPVLEELSSPASYLIDSNSTAFFARSETVSLTNKIIGEVPLIHFAPYNTRSVIRYDANELHYYALLDTKLFKQLEYSLYYRHRITQQLVPLVLSNYGSVNIKFVFRPIS